MFGELIYKKNSPKGIFSLRSKEKWNKHYNYYYGLFFFLMDRPFDVIQIDKMVDNGINGKTCRTMYLQLGSNITPVGNYRMCR